MTARQQRTLRRKLERRLQRSTERLARLRQRFGPEFDRLVECVPMVEDDDFALECGDELCDECCGPLVPTLHVSPGLAHLFTPGPGLVVDDDDDDESERPAERKRA